MAPLFKHSSENIEKFFVLQFEQGFTKNYNFSQQLHFLYLLTFIYINIMISKICLQIKQENTFYTFKMLLSIQLKHSYLNFYTHPNTFISRKNTYFTFIYTLTGISSFLLAILL